jgi:hypothetical protein
MSGIAEALQEIMKGQTEILGRFGVHEEHHKAVEIMVKLHDQVLYGTNGSPGLKQEHAVRMAKGGCTEHQPQPHGLTGRWALKCLLGGALTLAGGATVTALAYGVIVMLKLHWGG